MKKSDQSMLSLQYSEQFKILATKVQLEEMGVRLVFDFKDVFEPIPHVNQLPADVYCTIELKDATQKITSRSYSTP